MGLFGGQFSSVVEWKEYSDDIIFWKFPSSEIKKGSRLIIRPGQDAIFMYNGRIEGIFREEGNFDISSDIIPFLSTLKSFTFGFNTPLRAEVLFINTKEFTVKWGTKNAINLPVQGLPGGMPIRAFGTFSFKVSDEQVLIDKIAGIKSEFNVEDIKERVMSMLDMLMMKWISKEGKDMFNLQANAYDIGKGIASDLDMEMVKIGIAITSFTIQSVSYPEEVAKMQQKAAAQSMIGNVNTYTQMQMADALTQPNTAAGSMAGNMAGMQMGMAMGQMMGQMMNGNMQDNAQQNQAAPASNGTVPKFCPNCGTPTNGARFCSNCGTKLA